MNIKPLKNIYDTAALMNSEGIDTEMQIDSVKNNGHVIFCPHIVLDQLLNWTCGSVLEAKSDEGVTDFKNICYGI